MRLSFLAVPTTALLLVLLSGCEPSASQAAPPPPEVRVTLPEQKQIQDWDEYTGRFAAEQSVEIQARVSGYLQAVHFEDGQNVKTGDLLFTIDPRPYQAAVDQAQAEVEQARAALDFSRLEYTRGEQLWKSKSISKEDYDQRRLAWERASAELSAAHAALEQAQLELGFTQIKAPISGRISNFYVSPGNLISSGSNATVLTSIVSRDPIHFYISASERDALKHLRLHGGQPGADRAITQVELKLADEEDFGHIGRVDFVDNRIDSASGTVRVRARFSNPEGLFVPGMFARLRVPISEPYQALLIPDLAIGSDHDFKFVYVIDENNTAQYRRVELGPLQGELRVIRSGLDAGDRVIIGGIQRVRPGSVVTPVSAEQ